MRKGFSLLEILIVIAILSLIMIIVMVNLRGQTAKAFDAKRKTDLYKLHTALEEYANDHGSYPADSLITNCDGTDLAPSLGFIPCDPERQTPYGYFLSTTGGFRVCTQLSYTADPVIENSGCDGPEGCGLGGGYNYCLAAGTTASAVGTEDEVPFNATPTPTRTPTPTPGPTPTPTPIPTPTPTPPPGGWYACTPTDGQGQSVCNHYENPWVSGCPTYFVDADCSSACGNPANRCQF